MRTHAQPAAAQSWAASGRAQANRAAYLAGLRAGRAGRITESPRSSLTAAEYRAGLLAGFRGGLLAARRRQEGLAL